MFEKKVVLGAIDRGEGLGAFLLLLVGARVGDPGGGVIGEQAEEVTVRAVELPTGADADDEEPVRSGPSP
jgi:hypothetical protein